MDESIFVSSFDSSARVLYGTLMRTQSLKDLTQINLDKSYNLKWSETMSGFGTVSKQLESVWMDIQPDAFSMSLVVPKDIIVNQPTLIPQLLLTSLPKEELKAIHKPDDSYSIDSHFGDFGNDSFGNKRKAEEDLYQLIQKHNENLAAASDEFNNIVDDWKKSLQDEQKKRRFKPSKKLQSQK